MLMTCGNSAEDKDTEVLQYVSSRRDVAWWQLAMKSRWYGSYCDFDISLYNLHQCVLEIEIKWILWRIMFYFLLRRNGTKIIFKFHTFIKCMQTV